MIQQVNQTDSLFWTHNDGTEIFKQNVRHVLIYKVSFYADDPPLSVSGVRLSVSRQSNWSAKASSRWGMVSSTPTSLCSLALSDVTPLPSIPHGTMWPNHDMSVLQFRAKPWDVMYRPQWIPAKTQPGNNIHTRNRSLWCCLSFFSVLSPLQRRPTRWRRQKVVFNHPRVQTKGSSGSLTRTLIAVIKITLQNTRRCHAKTVCTNTFLFCLTEIEQWSWSVVPSRAG